MIFKSQIPYLSKHFNYSPKEYVAKAEDPFDLTLKRKILELHDINKN